MCVVLLFCFKLHYLLCLILFDKLFGVVNTFKPSRGNQSYFVLTSTSRLTSWSLHLLNLLIFLFKYVVLLIEYKTCTYQLLQAVPILKLVGTEGVLCFKTLIRASATMDIQNIKTEHALVRKRHLITYNVKFVNNADLKPIVKKHTYM